MTDAEAWPSHLFETHVCLLYEPDQVSSFIVVIDSIVSDLWAQSTLTNYKNVSFFLFSCLNFISRRQGERVQHALTARQPWRRSGDATTTVNQSATLVDSTTNSTTWVFHHFYFLFVVVYLSFFTGFRKHNRHSIDGYCTQIHVVLLYSYR